VQPLDDLVWVAGRVIAAQDLNGDIPQKVEIAFEDIVNGQKDLESREVSGGNRTIPQKSANFGGSLVRQNGKAAGPLKLKMPPPRLNPISGDYQNRTLPPSVTA
jgi:hypothetical protein